MPTTQAFPFTGLFAAVIAACVITAPPNGFANPPNRTATPPNAAGASPNGAVGRNHLLTVLAIAEVNGGDVARAASALGAISLSDLSGSTGTTGDAADTGNRRELGDRREPIRAAGGAAFADFESLKQLIRTTVNPDTWEDLGGPSSMFEYPQGVFVDPAGTVRVDGALPDSAVATLNRLGQSRSASRRLEKVSPPDDRPRRRRVARPGPDPLCLSDGAARSMGSARAGRSADRRRDGPPGWPFERSLRLD